MKKIYAATLLLCFLLTFSKPALADHVSGGEITYKCTSTSGIFEITMVLYRDCLGIPMCSGVCGTACTRTISIMGADASCASVNFGNVVLTLENVRDVDVNPHCPSSKTVCNNMGCVTPGTYTPGYERYEFRGLANIGNTSGIPPSCCNVRFAFNECCRSAYINTGSSWEDFYIEAIVNRCLAVSPCNSSPIYSNDPAMGFCGGENVIYNGGAYDPDGDSLSYAFAPALRGYGLSVRYDPPWSYDRPMPWTGNATADFPAGIKCDPNTGDIMFTPGNASGMNFYGVVVQEIKQWKKISGVPTVMGVTRRDVNMTILANCLPNGNPYLRTIPLSSGLTTRSFQTCEGSQLCFDVLAIDADTILGGIKDSTFLSCDTNMLNRGATFSKNYIDSNRKNTGPREDSYRFCWSPPAGSASGNPYYFYVKGTDNRCPRAGRVMNSFSVKVNPTLTTATLAIAKATTGCNQWSFSYTNTTPSIAITKTFWQIKRLTQDYNEAYTTDTFSNVVSTPQRTFNILGSYVISLTAYNGSCAQIYYDTVVISSNILQIKLRKDTSLCNTNSVTLTGTPIGTGPFTYKWFNSINDTLATPLNAPNYTSANVTISTTFPKNYTLQLTDSFGCRMYDSTRVNISNAVRTIVLTPATCYGKNNGKIEVKLYDSSSSYPAYYNYKLKLDSGGTYSYSRLLSNIAPGLHDIYIRDNYNCVTIVPQLSITQPSVFRDTLKLITNETCQSSNNGSISIAGIGGTPPYRFSKDSISYNTTGLFSALAPTNYKIHLKDSNNCYVLATATINKADTFSITVVKQNPICNTANNGQIKAVPFGGKAPFKFSLTFAGTYVTDSVFTNLTIGTYTVYVKDSSNCVLSKTVTLTSPTTTITLNAVSTNITCMGNQNGSVLLSASGGVSPLLFYKETGIPDTIKLYNNLPAGAHTFYVMDSLGCTKSITKNITEPRLLKDTLTLVTHETCFNQKNGLIQTLATGGTTPYRYSKDSILFNTTRLYSNLAPATYKIHILDKNNCYTSVTRTIVAADSLYHLTSVLNQTCFGKNNGEIRTQGKGGKAQYTYRLGTTGSYNNDSIYKNLVANTYTLNIKDQNNCTVTFTKTITTPPVIIAGSITGNSTALQNITESYSITPLTGLNYTWGVQKGTILSGQNTPSVSVNWDSIGVGGIGVVVYSDSTCGDTATLVVNIGVNSLSELAKNFGLEVYPNPSSGLINITLQKLPVEHSLKLYDMQGKLLIEQELKNSQQLNLESLPQGMYMLKIGEWHGQIIKK